MESDFNKTMNYYVFECVLIPRDRNPAKGSLPGAYSHTWVQAESLESARVRVFDFFADSEWQVVRFETELEGDLERHPWNHRDTQQGGEIGGGLHQSWLQLMKFGIGSEIFAYLDDNEKNEEA